MVGREDGVDPNQAKMILLSNFLMLSNIS